MLPVALGPLVAARVAWQRHPLAPAAATIVGVVLLIWVAVELAIIAKPENPNKIRPGARHGREQAGRLWRPEVGEAHAR